MHLTEPPTARLWWFRNANIKSDCCGICSFFFGGGAQKLEAKNTPFEKTFFTLLSARLCECRRFWLILSYYLWESTIPEPWSQREEKDWFNLPILYEHTSCVETYHHSEGAFFLQPPTLVIFSNPLKHCKSFCSLTGAYYSVTCVFSNRCNLCEMLTCTTYRFSAKLCKSKQHSFPSSRSRWNLSDQVLLFLIASFPR